MFWEKTATTVRIAEAIWKGEVPVLKRCIKKRMSTEAYASYLLDLVTCRYWERRIPEIPVFTRGTMLLRSPEPFTPFELLAIAVIGQAVIDYLELAVELLEKQYRKTDSRYLMKTAELREMEKFFHMNAITETVWEQMVWTINRTDSSEWTLDCIKRTHGRFMANIGRR